MAVEGYARVRATCAASSDHEALDEAPRDLPVWITEMSWSTGGGRHPFVTSERGQARRLRDAYNLLLACHRRWNLGRVYWFSHRDQPVPSGSGDYWGNHNGLIAADGRWKPGMRAFLRYLRVRAPRVRAGLRPLTACGSAASATMAPISTSAPFGSAAAATATRAGGSSPRRTPRRPRSRA